MATRKDIQQQFAELGVEPNDEVLDKCVEICVLNDIDVEEFVETWMAFSLSHLNGAEPTIETVLLMERKEFANRDVNTPKQDATPLRIFNGSLNSSITIEENDTYCGTPKVKTKTQNQSQFHEAASSGVLMIATSRVNRNTTPKVALTDTKNALFSPASYSPNVGTPSSNYAERNNAKQVVLSHRNSDCINWKSANDCWTPASVGLYVTDTSEPKIDNLKNRLMMESVPVKIDIYNDHIENLTKQIIKDHKLEEPSNFVHPNSEKFVTAGSIYSLDVRLQKNSVALQTSETFSQGLTIELNLQQLLMPNTTCSGLFPGQVVAVEGVNPIGDKINVQKIYSPMPLPLPPIPVLEGALQIAIAAGPFTQIDNLLYEPLEDFVSYIKQNEPHVAIIIGPLIDRMHPLIIDGSLAMTFEEFYNKIITGFMEQLSSCKTQIVVVASSRDVAQCPVYPTVPSVVKQFPRLMTVSDPSLLEVNGLVIGVSATDVVMHLSREEVALPNQCIGDRLGRLSSHLLSQRNFYPLHPPPEDLPLDTALWENLCNLPVTPHILILPSDLRYFIKNVGDCLVVNPERLTKGQVGGTFARLNVYKSRDVNDWSPTTHITGQVLKI